MPNAALFKEMKITLCDQSFLKGMAADGRAQVLSGTCVCISQDVSWLYSRSVWSLMKNRRGDNPGPDDSEKSSHMLLVIFVIWILTEKKDIFFLSFSAPYFKKRKECKIRTNVVLIKTVSTLGLEAESCWELVTPAWNWNTFSSRPSVSILSPLPTNTNTFTS